MKGWCDRGAPRLPVTVANTRPFVPKHSAPYNHIMRDTLKEMLDRDPFRPFHIVLMSGDRYEVTNPHLVGMG